MSMVVAGIIGGGLAIGSSIFGASAASKREKAARREKKRLQNKQQVRLKFKLKNQT